MKLLDRYIGGAVLLGTMLVLAVLLTLLGVLVLVDELGDVGQGSFDTADALLISLLSMPRYAFQVFPVAALIGSLLGLGVLASHGELTAMRSAGISLSRILRSVMLAGVAMVLVTLLVGELLAPYSENLARRIKAEQQSEQATLQSRYGFWARDGDAFINIRSISAGSGLADIYLYEFDKERRLELASHANLARYDGNRWVLDDIAQSHISEQGVKTGRLARATLESLLDPNLLATVVVEPTLLPAWGLYQYISFMHDNNQDATAYEVAFWSKFATPLATLVMLYLAVPFVLGSLRSVGIGQRIFAGAMVGTVFFLFNRAFAYMAVVYSLNPMLSTLLPVGGLLLIGALYLRRVR